MGKVSSLCWKSNNFIWRQINLVSNQAMQNAGLVLDTGRNKQRQEAKGNERRQKARGKGHAWVTFTSAFRLPRSPSHAHLPRISAYVVTIGIHRDLIEDQIPIYKPNPPVLILKGLEFFGFTATPSYLSFWPQNPGGHRRSRFKFPGTSPVYCHEICWFPDKVKCRSKNNFGSHQRRSKTSCHILIFFTGVLARGLTDFGLKKLL